MTVWPTLVAAWVIAGWALAAGLRHLQRARARRDRDSAGSTESLLEILETLRPRSRSTRVLEAFAMVALSGLLGPLLLIAWLWAARRRPVGPVAAQEEPPALVRAETLVARTTVEAVEAEWQVVDPLGGAPEVPFGHLNARWRALVATMQDRDELWRFEAEQGDRWFKERVGGYAVLRGAAPVTHWVCERLGRVDADADG